MSPTARIDPHLITASLELAAERAADITPLVYARLFARLPEMEPRFVRDTTGAVKGEMLARVFEIILDYIDRRSYADHMIQSEVITHDGYGVPRERFGVFFEVVAETLGDGRGEAWTTQMDASWECLLHELDYFVQHPDQRITA